MKRTEQEISEIRRLRTEGATFVSIGKQYGISTERIRQIIAKAERVELARANTPYNPMQDLSVMARNSLAHCGLTTPALVREAILEGRFDLPTHAKGRIPQLGAKGKAEVRKWLETQMVTSPTTD